MTTGIELWDDTQLVNRCLDGDREAFGRVVERYQGLICALAYSACGDLGRSEDLAQDTFLAAWRNLKSLKNHDRLKQWLCGIARHRIQESFRRATRDPISAPAPLEEDVADGRDSFQPSEQTMNREEQAILWRSIKRIPETYREPLVLFYREHQSVGNVASALELSEDAVKQRLSRGRKLLHEQVLAFVEGALERTNPGRAFTLGVLAALPLMTASAKAAVIGATAAKSSAVAKAAGLAGLFSAVLGLAGMVLGPYLGYRMDRADARSPQRREFITKYYRILAMCIAGFVLAVFSLTLVGWPPLLKSRPMLYVGLMLGLGVGYIIIVAVLTLWMRRSLRKIRQQEIADHRPAPLMTPVFEYRSKLNLLGWPLVHFRLRCGLERGPVKAWIAGGDAAIGLIFAFGAVAIAPISFGGFAVGLLTLGGFAVGVVTFGGFSLGPWALGGLAVGLQAFGGCAVGWTAAQGGVAVARDFAVGGVALAQHDNDAVAGVFMRDSTFFQNATVFMRHVQWLNLIWLLPLVLWWRRRRMARSQQPPVDR